MTARQAGRFSSASPRDPRNSRVPAAVAGAVVVLVVLFLAGSFLVSGDQNRGPGVEQFLAGRETIALGELDQGMVFGGSCVNGYRIQMVGISDGRRHLLATIDLNHDPGSEDELFSLLAGEGCKEEMAEVLSRMNTAFPADLKQDSDVLLFSYRTKQGKRFLP